jgi:endonuclease/exonuclease/phosphatase family metal-dependent hydrolase
MMLKQNAINLTAKKLFRLALWASTSKLKGMRHFLSVLVAAFVFATWSGCATGSSGGSKPMTVMTYNIHHAEGTDGVLDLERIARIIREQKPDLVALQEVDDSAARSGRVAQSAELGRLTGMYAVFGKAMDFQGGAYGQAILSRWKIKDHQVHQLPQRVGREPRILLVTAIEAPMGVITFASVHLDHEIEEIRLQQAAAVNHRFAAGDTPSLKILAGDFNAGPDSGTMKAFAGDWLDSAENAGFTIPAGNPRRRIDYILATPKSAWRAVRSEVLNEPVASDHRPVVAQIEWMKR